VEDLPIRDHNNYHASLRQRDGYWQTFVRPRLTDAIQRRGPASVIEYGDAQSMLAALRRRDNILTPQTSDQWFRLASTRCAATAAPYRPPPQTARQPPPPGSGAITPRQPPASGYNVARQLVGAPGSANTAMMTMPCASRVAASQLSPFPQPAVPALAFDNNGTASVTRGQQDSFPARPPSVIYQRSQGYGSSGHSDMPRPILPAHARPPPSGVLHNAGSRIQTQPLRPVHRHRPGQDRPDLDLRARQHGQPGYHHQIFGTSGSQSLPRGPPPPSIHQRAPPANFGGSQPPHAANQGGYGYSAPQTSPRNYNVRPVQPPTTTSPYVGTHAAPTQQAQSPPRPFPVAVRLQNRTPVSVEVAEVAANEAFGNVLTSRQGMSQQVLFAMADAAFERRRSPAASGTDRSPSSRTTTTQPSTAMPASP
jgi:hypothetical protein